MHIQFRPNGAFGLKGRFYQPRPEAWETNTPESLGPVGAVQPPIGQVNEPFRFDWLPGHPSQASGLG
jgi:hypothetical protein